MHTTCSCIGSINSPSNCRIPPPSEASTYIFTRSLTSAFISYSIFCISPSLRFSIIFVKGPLIARTASFLRRRSSLKRVLNLSGSILLKGSSCAKKSSLMTRTIRRRGLLSNESAICSKKPLCCSIQLSG